jgi:hypothetical protein
MSIEWALRARIEKNIPASTISFVEGYISFVSISSQDLCPTHSIPAVAVIERCQHRSICRKSRKDDKNVEDLMR